MAAQAVPCTAREDRPALQRFPATIEFCMPFQEVVEAEGHLIDSHIMENIFDKVVEYNSRFEVEQFRIGRTNSDASYLRLKVEAPSQDVMEHLLQQLLGLGCSPVSPARAKSSISIV